METLSLVACVPAVDHAAFTCARILDILLAHRRGDIVQNKENVADAAHFAAQLAQLRPLVEARTPIIFTLPAFPCKSPNRNKVLGALPDMAERLSLRFLQQLCDAVTQIYAPGAQILICSDGHVFGDLIHVADPVIDRYAHAFLQMIDEEKISCIDVFHLGHVYGCLGYDQKRQRLSEEWGQPLAYLREECLTNADSVRLYCGITRFLVEDAGATVALSKAARQRDCRRRAYRVMQRSRAWGALIAQHHPRTVRLSIHPQPATSVKFGIMLLDAADQWLTPWHAVAVEGEDDVVLMKHAEAARVARLVHWQGRPSHYTMRPLAGVVCPAALERAPASANVSGRRIVI